MVPKPNISRLLKALSSHLKCYYKCNWGRKKFTEFLYIHINQCLWSDFVYYLLFLLTLIICFDQQSGMEKRPLFLLAAMSDNQALVCSLSGVRCQETNKYHNAIVHFKY